MKMELKKPKAFHNLITIYRTIWLLPRPREKVDIFLALKFHTSITILSVIGVIGLGGHLMQIMRAGPQYRNDQIDDINAILQCCIAGSYAAILLLVGNKMLNFFDRLEENKPNNIMNVVKKFEKFSAAYYKTTLFMCFVYAVDNTFKDSYCSLKDYVDDDVTLICGSMIPMWFPLRLGVMSQYIVKIANLFMLMVYFPPAMTIPAFGLGSIEMVVARIKHLKWMLKQVKFGEETNIELTKTQLKNCIKYFIEIKSLIRYMDSSVGLLFIPQYTLMSTILALLEYQMIVQFSAATVIRFSGWVFMEFIICMKGQQLLDESLDLARSVYNMRWYEMHPEIYKMYKILHMAVQQPIKFRAKPFVSLDTKFFMHVLKSSYSLMMFFRTWSNEI